MKNIGFLFGNEKNFSQNVIKKINANNTKIAAEPITVGIINNFNKNIDCKYDVIFDRFSNAVPFYHSAMKFLSENGIKVVNSSHSHQIEEELITLTKLKNHKINIPKTAIIPSKNLPNGVQGDDMRNSQYPLDWDKMFDTIGFPANIKSNNSNDLFDTYRIYNKQDFFFIYDMSDTKTLLYQECVEAKQNIRIFIVGKNRTYLIYDLHKASKDRYSIFEEYVDDKTERSIEDMIKTIQTLFNLDMFILDVAIDKKDKLYLLSINLFSMNIDNTHFPAETYNWLVDNTAEMLIGLTNELETKKLLKEKEENEKAKLKEKENKEKSIKTAKVKEKVKIEPPPVVAVTPPSIAEEQPKPLVEAPVSIVETPKPIVEEPTSPVVVVPPSILEIPKPAAGTTNTSVTNPFHNEYW